MSNCPCGSHKHYNECCGAYISEHKKPETPEKLMRSRYTAYTLGNMDYIIKTMKAPAAQRFSAATAKQWATTVEWLGLEIKQSTMNQTKGYVEFIAHFKEAGKKDGIHEISEFHQIDGQWYYVDGKYKKPKPYAQVKIGRNDPCFCESGKKYKNCCLNKEDV